MSFYITKASGKRELFDESKFKRSLERSGAKPETINTLLELIKQQPELRSTQDIYHWALEQLKKINPPVAARYNLKQALLQFGPTGFPFEKYIAQLMQAQGYTTQTDQTLPGKCVTHEIDIVFYKGNSYNFAECKFHNSQGLTTAIQVPLYVRARFDDVVELWSSQPGHHNKQHDAWVITNTRFTSESIKYGTCANLKLLSWAYPAHEGLRELIDKYGLHPITALTSLKTGEMKELVGKNLVLCKDVQKHIGLLKDMGITGTKLEHVIAEAEGVCKI